MRALPINCSAFSVCLLVTNVAKFAVGSSAVSQYSNYVDAVARYSKNIGSRTGERKPEESTPSSTWMGQTDFAAPYLQMYAMPLAVAPGQYDSLNQNFASPYSNQKQTLGSAMKSSGGQAPLGTQVKLDGDCAPFISSGSVHGDEPYNSQAGLDSFSLMDTWNDSALEKYAGTFKSKLSTAQLNEFQLEFCDLLQRKHFSVAANSQDGAEAVKRFTVEYNRKIARLMFSFQQIAAKLPKQTTLRENIPAQSMTPPIPPDTSIAPPSEPKQQLLTHQSISAQGIKQPESLNAFNAPFSEAELQLAPRQKMPSDSTMLPDLPNRNSESSPEPEQQLGNDVIASVPVAHATAQLELSPSSLEEAAKPSATSKSTPHEAPDAAQFHAHVPAVALPTSVSLAKTTQQKGWSIKIPVCLAISGLVPFFWRRRRQTEIQQEEDQTVFHRLDRSALEMNGASSFHDWL